MSALLRDLDQLSQQNATQVKNKWGEVARQVQQEGVVAITNHSTVEMVLLTAGVYRQLTELLNGLKDRERKAKVDELRRRFDQRLATLQKADFTEAVDNMFAARGKLKSPPIAGETF